MWHVNFRMHKSEHTSTPEAIIQHVLVTIKHDVTSVIAFTVEAGAEKEEPHQSKDPHHDKPEY